MAGQVGFGAGVESDLRPLVRAAVRSAPSPPDAAVVVRNLFDPHATAVRAHDRAGVVPVPELECRPPTIAVAAGEMGGAIGVQAAALTDIGRCQSQPVTPYGSMVLAPFGTLHDAVNDALASINSQMDPLDAMTVVADAIRSVSPRLYPLVSYDLDAVTLRPSVAPELTHLPLR